MLTVIPCNTRAEFRKHNHSECYGIRNFLQEFDITQLWEVLGKKGSKKERRKIRGKSPSWPLVALPRVDVLEFSGEFEGQAHPATGLGCSPCQGCVIARWETLHALLRAAKHTATAILVLGIHLSMPGKLNTWSPPPSKSHNPSPWVGPGHYVPTHTSISRHSFRTSLVGQWLRICLPMQGTCVWSLVWEDLTCRGATKPVRHSYWAQVPQLLKPVCPRIHAPHNEKPTHRNKE